MNKTERKFLAARLAEESIVLLKNDDGLLHCTWNRYCWNW